MTPEQIDQLIRELMKTGEILATRLYEVALRQVYVEVVGGFTAAFIFSIVFVVSYKFHKHGEKMRERSHYSDWETPYVLGAILSVLSPIAVILFVLDAVSRLINPQWYALKLLLGTFVGQ